ncbi:hypothetical protein GLOIN_2v1532769 [Rhizophagus irregularis DAOM 181602=DAOM 197198]|uniref:Uncharacterized protein n=1 Tax=Rhizophagus irregularis (strain DAOM 181602 / DAOM 197198 / MUCL 43194) TaxID=747089 RepID=A0A2P4QMP9_RHIID|nr:hypothetical protein GLOIN_2v1532769 [Rhizophagus irregularis DAOM 181602=DAOM 197198]POG78868.1 hypothetical protein GLOIN_2v1532769 [Rhizophagus irregularis DAOM 181602=DAOM 197198]|eukprot:XP_025185734.1 hypothetical protein GLOIN_2v1532769 [Rhizophagus irregularis DAOM 181602=DAOM 197198]
MENSFKNSYVEEIMCVLGISLLLCIIKIFEQNIFLLKHFITFIKHFRVEWGINARILM